MTPAVAIFAKTPGLSPVKTRLAAGIGTRRAALFHRLAAAGCGEVAGRCAGRLAPIWAVAERAGLDHPAWASHPRTWQGEGGLGERMHAVYARLLARYGTVILIGCDTPHMTPALLLDAARLLASGDGAPILGRAPDGGFWLFGGTRPIPREAWAGVAYSQDDTAERFAAAIGGARPFATMHDADRCEDLPAVLAGLEANADPTPAQARLRRWLRRLLGPGGMARSEPGVGMA